MIIILCPYLVALRAVFSKFRLLRWGWLSRDHLAKRVCPRDFSRVFLSSRAVACAGSGRDRSPGVDSGGWAPVRPISSRPDAKLSECAQKAHVFRLSCKIPIINLSELVRGFAIMKARAPAQDATVQPTRALLAVLIWKRANA
jgi:hypothetical protein